MSRATDVSAASAGPERRRALALLGLLIALFFGFAALYVRRLNNFMMGDMEFTGWVGPVAERFGTGERPYIDFVLPIPPGSFLLLNLIQRVTGEALLLQELWVAAIGHLTMALLGYAMARPLVGRLNAVLVAIATLVTVLQIHKECTYDHAAQVVVWGGLTLGLYALLSDGRRARLLWLGAGYLTGLTLVFKQSTATGALLGWLTAFGYLILVQWIRPARLISRQSVLWWGAGLALGWLTLLAVLLAIGSTPSAFWQAAFVDGSELKGGTYKLFFNVFSYVFRHEAYPSSFFFSLLLIAVLLRWVKRHGDLALPSAPAPALTRRRALIIAGGVAVVFGVAILLLASGARETFGPAVYWLKQTQNIPAFGLFFGCALFVGQLRARRDQPPLLGHQLSALAIAVLATSLFHNTSFPGLRPFYDNNPITPLAFIFLCIALDRAELPYVKYACIGLVLLGLLGPKFHRALDDHIPVGRSGHWAGLYVNERGAEVVRAALRVRQLAGEHDTVLTLPEDVQFQRLLGRPRPPIKGAIVFADQYARRLAADDIATLEANPPKVIVIHPRRERLWMTLFELWGGRESGAWQVTQHVRQELLPKRYRLDRSYRTVFFRERAELDVYVRIDP